ncbi:MAG: aminotransferase class I/II-fold pyridoxal phosphate-dependent enzyme, partial [Burkholderiales bacterium]|nr:aminotransferase class I/II-fold pyridoxal phosphate-dependent enzyme [Burkholderiales bacterium]
MARLRTRSDRRLPRGGFGRDHARTRGDARRSRLWQLIAQLRDGLAGTRWHLLPSPTAIQPVIIGDNHEALRIAGALYERGLWVPAIRPPTVAKGTARLRVSLTAS